MMDTYGVLALTADNKGNATNTLGEELVRVFVADRQELLNEGLIASVVVTKSTEGDVENVRVVSLLAVLLGKVCLAEAGEHAQKPAKARSQAVDVVERRHEAEAKRLNLGVNDISEVAHASDTREVPATVSCKLKTGY